MKFNYGLAPILIGISIVLVQTQVAVALSSQEVGKIAREITVQIESQESPGSGIIIKKEGNVYTVLTAAHVVKKSPKYAIIAPDGQRYAASDAKPVLNNIDLAVVKFTSNQNYPTAKIGNSDESIIGTTVYVYGFPTATAATRSRLEHFKQGKITANATKPLPEGYALAYDNDTLQGMSGGPVLNDKGELVGIHGRGESAPQPTDITGVNILKTPRNFAVPINTFLRISTGVGVNLGISAPAVVATAPKADDFLIQGVDKLQKSNYKEAIADLNEAIRLNPKNVNAYTARSEARARLQDFQGAIADLDQAIKINPNDTVSYQNRGLLRLSLKDLQGALADFNRVIKSQPENAPIRFVRGNLRYELKDFQGALADFSFLIKKDPKSALGYILRGFSRYELKDFQGAMAEFNQGINIDPKDTEAYRGRGLVRRALKDFQGAMADFNQAININPSNPEYLAKIYVDRGFTHFELGDKQASITDLQKAAEIYRQEGDTKSYQSTLQSIRKIQQ